jgi:lysophospholipase L1-like esterase
MIRIERHHWTKYLPMHYLVLCMIVYVLVSANIVEATPAKLLITWEPLENVVSYELEITEKPERNKTKSAIHAVYRYNKISAPGIEIATDVLPSPWNRLYYRVRALDLDQRPISNYTSPKPLSAAATDPDKPFSTSLFSRQPVPLYPTYSWIPVLGADHYEVEVLNHAPENPNGQIPSQYELYHVTIEHGYSFDCYDWTAFRTPGTYYWRVIAYDEDNNPIGGYSDAVSFTIDKVPTRIAALGDSITHGGGAISNPPSDVRYDYTSYFSFPVKNLGRSGDTISTTLDRFDEDVLAFKPEVLLILTGSNSLRGGEGADTIISGLEALKEKCQANGITPIWITLPPINPSRIEKVFGEGTAPSWKKDLIAVNSWIKRQSYYVDIYSSLVGADGCLPVRYAADGLHPDMEAKRIMARKIQKKLRMYKLIK